MDVLLINLLTKMRTVNNESLALNYLAGYVRPLGYEVGILDGAILNLSYEQIDDSTKIRLAKKQVLSIYLHYQLGNGVNTD